MRIEKRQNNIYTKSLDKVEAHLVNIISRYFNDNKEDISKNVEQIINETINRVKIDIINGDIIDFAVTSVNGEKGDVIVNCDKIGAEPKFDKNTAFNKNFGNVKNTVCEGNDPRLSDARTPLEHEHDGYIVNDDIEKLIEQFLAKKGITFHSGKIQLTNNNFEIINGELVEV